MLRFARPKIVISSLILAAIALACGDSTRTMGPTAPSFWSGGGKSAAHEQATYHLATCKPRSPHFNSAGIGPNGGVLQVGPNKLVVPAGALDHHQTLTGEVDSLDVVNIEFGPEGLQFEVPAQLTLNTNGCAIPDGAMPQIVYVQDGVITEVIPSVFDAIHNKITGPIHHFSGYSIALLDDQQ